MPAKITDAVRKKAIEKNKFFMKAILPFYKRDFNLTDPLFAKYFGKTQIQSQYIDYFKVVFFAKFYIALEKRIIDEYQFFRGKSNSTSKTVTSNAFFQHSIVFSNLTYQRVFSLITMTFEFSLLF